MAFLSYISIPVVVSGKCMYVRIDLNSLQEMASVHTAQYLEGEDMHMDIDTSN